MATLPTTASGQGEPELPRTDPVVEFVASTKGISIHEASNLLTAQQRIIAKFEAGAVGDLDGYGGLWVDEGEQIRIGATSPETAEQMALKLGKESRNVQFVSVAFSYAELSSTLESVSAEIQKLSDKDRLGVSVSLDIPRNRVVLSLPGRPNEGIKHPLARQGEASNVEVSWEGTAPSPNTCTPGGPYCNRLRGGVQLDAVGGGYCSAGFYARSKSDSKPYMITAGHCDSTTWQSTKPSGSTPGTYVVGPRHSGQVGIFGDFGLVAINNPLGWQPKPWVVVLASAHTTANNEYPIKSVQGSYVGLSVCKTGATTGTTCGVVSALGWSGYYDSGEFVANLARVDYCADSGDSGGPVYRLNGAYGLHVAGWAGCDELYTSVGAAEAQLNVDVAFAP